MSDIILDRNNIVVTWHYNNPRMLKVGYRETSSKIGFYKKENNNWIFVDTSTRMNVIQELVPFDENLEEYVSQFMALNPKYNIGTIGVHKEYKPVI